MLPQQVWMVKARLLFNQPVYTITVVMMDITISTSTIRTIERCITYSIYLNNLSSSLLFPCL